ncbi:hypothetical protein F4802DRAFT_58501 [Xylaria palmicola]|nr:hypothetical protein F4802DRAFT_58501 [Xylaria palmicola]
MPAMPTGCGHHDDTTTTYPVLWPDGGCGRESRHDVSCMRGGWAHWSVASARPVGSLHARRMGTSKSGVLSRLRRSGRPGAPTDVMAQPSPAPAAQLQRSQLTHLTNRDCGSPGLADSRLQVQGFSRNPVHVQHGASIRLSKVSCHSSLPPFYTAPLVPCTDNRGLTSAIGQVAATIIECSLSRMITRPSANVLLSRLLSDCHHSTTSRTA